MTTMMECGHAANATSDGKPCCVLCVSTATDASMTVAASAPDLTGRTAQCGCGRLEPSNPSLAFFEFKGPGSRTSSDICKNCRYSLAAHDPVEMARNVPSDRRTVVELGKCPGFEPHGPFEYDRFYCGCRGWD